MGKPNVPCHQLKTFIDLTRCGQGKEINQLFLANAKIGKAGAQGIRYIFSSGMCKELESMDLSFDRKHLTILLEALAHKNRPYIKKMSFWNCALNDKDIQRLVSVLSQQCPQQLSLGRNKVSDLGASALADFIESGNVPDGFNLILESNSIGNCGAIRLAAAITNCKEKITINLRDNTIFEKGEKALAEAMKKTNHVFLLYHEEEKTKQKKELNTNQHIIRHCSLRNSLIERYPTFATYINNLSSAHSLYEPKENLRFQPLSLKSWCTLFICKNHLLPDVSREDIPAEIHMFQEQLIELTEILKEEYGMPWHVRHHEDDIIINSSTLLMTDIAQQFQSSRP